MSRIVPSLGLASVLVAASGAAGQLAPVWLARGPRPASQINDAGLRGFAVDRLGNSFAAGGWGVSSNNDIIVSKRDPAGTPLWQTIYDGPARWHDQAKGVAISPDGLFAYLAGNTPGQHQYADGLLLKLDAATGARIWERTFDGGLFIADAWLSIVADDQGNVFVGGWTNGDGPDCLVAKYSPSGDLLWSRTWDGPAHAPYSLEAVTQVAIGPDGHLVMLTPGVANDNHPDFVVVKYHAQTGATLWEGSFGVRGYDEPTDMVIATNGDVIVTGVGIDITNKFSTARFSGQTGALLWHHYDFAGMRDSARAVALDSAGDVYITGSTDPDGNQSNFNDNFLTVKRRGDDGSLVWRHQYGANCVGCNDVPSDVIVDRADNIFVIGRTSSAPYVNDQILFLLDVHSGMELSRGVNELSGSEALLGGTLRLDGSHNLMVGSEIANYDTGIVEPAVARYASLAGGCYADCDTSTGPGTLDIFDFLCFQNRFASASAYACDCDTSTGAGVCDIFDFLCFQNAFTAGCR